MTKGWRNDHNRDSAGYLHVWPENDLHPHVLEGLWCECDPFVSEWKIVTHHSFDKREQFERNRSKSS